MHIFVAHERKLCTLGYPTLYQNSETEQNPSFALNIVMQQSYVHRLAIMSCAALRVDQDG
eukprot:m.1043029 g.1043029  ORF g.1043029 m.1043029 type:complete len:60 (-) comp24163_c0_seq4:4472-4651(-)